MDRQKKVLLCMYVDDFCGFKEESFNFYIERRYVIEKGKIRRKSDEEIENFPNDFWRNNIPENNISKNNVSAVTLLIGENGAGKTTLMRLLIKWLCQLSVGHIPQEKGALVISVDGEGNNDDYKSGDKLIAFDKGELWGIEINKCKEIAAIRDIDEIKKLLSDIRLAYYTDTMTDLELSDILTKEELAFLQDDSLLTRLSNSIKSKYSVDSIKDCIKREDFAKQMKLFLYSRKERDDSMLRLPDCLQRFPIRYMKLTTKEVGNEKSFEGIPNGNGSLAREAVDLWNKVFGGDSNHNLSGISRILLWELFSGTITSMLKWERTLPKLENSIVTEKVRASLRAYIRTGNFKWNTVFKRFFTNLFSDCEKEFNGTRSYGEFWAEWSQQVEERINSFLDVLKNIEKSKFLKKWISSENAQNTWEFKLAYFDEKDGDGRSIWLPDWIELWEHYLTVAHLMPGCRFDWKYASSGGKNQSNLYINLFNIATQYSSDEIKQLWVLLDEPDNTFHPDWERRIIKNLLEICSTFDQNFQLLISTHSPIMLSDVPKPAAILLKTVEETKNVDNLKNEVKTEIKQQIYPKSSPFGQQIYTLFNDGFFMENGIIGEFAGMKIEEVYKELYKIEKLLLERENIEEEKSLEDFERDRKKYECIINLIEEPLLRGHLSQSYRLCKRIMEERQ